MTEALTVEERGRTITFTFDDMMRYHGPHSLASMAIAFRDTLASQSACASFGHSAHQRPVRDDPLIGDLGEIGMRCHSIPAR
jgi:hypothetical protein